MASNGDLPALLNTPEYVLKVLSKQARGGRRDNEKDHIIFSDHYKVLEETFH